MTIVLAVLKWLGILFGGILGLAVVLVLLVLFVPVRYKLHMVKQEEFCYGFRISFLYPVLFVRKRISGDDIVLCVFGIPVKSLSGTEGAEEQDRSTDRTKEKPERKKRERPGTADRQQTDDRVTIQEKKKNIKNTKKKSSGRKKTRNTSGRKKKKGRMHFLFQKISSIIKTIRSQETKKVIRLLKKELFALIGYIFPGKIRGEVYVGTGDPAYTGMLIGGISLIPAVYQKGFCVIPDFENQVLRADVTMTGRMRAVYFIRLFIRLYREKDIQRIWNRFRK